MSKEIWHIQLLSVWKNKRAWLDYKNIQTPRMNVDTLLRKVFTWAKTPPTPNTFTDKFTHNTWICHTWTRGTRVHSRNTKCPSIAPFYPFSRTTLSTLWSKTKRTLFYTQCFFWCSILPSIFLQSTSAVIHPTFFRGHTAPRNHAAESEAEGACSPSP